MGVPTRAVISWQGKRWQSPSCLVHPKNRSTHLLKIFSTNQRELKDVSGCLEVSVKPQPKSQPRCVFQQGWSTPPWELPTCSRSWPGKRPTTPTKSPSNQQGSLQISGFIPVRSWLKDMEWRHQEDQSWPPAPSSPTSPSSPSSPPSSTWTWSTPPLVLPGNAFRNETEKI